MNDSHTADGPRAPSQFKRFLKRLKNLFLPNGSNTLKESLEEALEEHDQSYEQSMDREETTLLRNALSFNELTVEDVMIPRASIEWARNDMSFDELQHFAVETGHTRFPVCHETLDEIIGFIHVKDLMSILVNKEKFLLDTLLRHSLFVPPSMRATTLLLKMQMAHVHIAMVIDEYGGTQGMVTLEDLMEEIVGEIHDEHDDDEAGKEFMQIGKNRFEISARMEIDSLTERLGAPLIPESDNYDTLGGFLLDIFGRVPTMGEVKSYSSEVANLEFEILDADLRSIKRVLLIRKKLPEMIMQTLDT